MSRLPSSESLSPGLVAFQGARGAYSEDALRLLWPSARPVPMRSNLDVARAVATGAVDAGVLPVENTLAGSVVATWDAIVATETVHAIAETVVPIHHCVMAPHGASLSDLVTVASHPVALDQCRGWFLRHPHVRAVAAEDTAGAAAVVASSGNRTCGAIAGRGAAALHGLSILAENIEDRPDNQTRFLALARAPRPVVEGVLCRTSLVLATANIPGALVAALTPLAAHGLNLTRVESRPTGEPWTYRFFVDVQHEAGSRAFTDALAALSHVATVRLVGTVPAHASHLGAPS